MKSQSDPTPARSPTQPECLRYDELPQGALEDLLNRFGLDLGTVTEGAEIPGSHWGAPEAGLLGQRVWVRGDTPVHSALHETCHVICMDSARRAELHTNAGGEVAEEDAVCYLQLLLANQLPGLDRARLMADMDAWGYSFRLGSTRAWFEEDAEDARQWLLAKGLIDGDETPTWHLR